MTSPADTNAARPPRMAEAPAAPWQRTLLPADAPIQAAIRNLNESGLQIVIVVTPGGALAGTVTDGDIRRGLLRGCTMDTPIGAIAQREPIVVPPHLSHDIVMHLMQANRIRQLPIVDDRRQVVGLHIWDKMLPTAATRANPMVIMAGGQGRRLRPHTENCPKPLLPVAGKPMLEHIIERAKGEGFRDFILSVHYLAHMIEDYFGSGERWEVRIQYVHEASPLGTAGALSLLDHRPDVPFVVSNGDVLTDIQYGQLLDFHCRHDAIATMAVRLHEWKHPFGVVQSDGVDITGFEEKPVARTHINAGIYVLDPRALNNLSVGEVCDMPTLFLRCHDKGQRTIIYPIYEPWMDVGRVDDLDTAQGFRAHAQT